MGGVGKTTLARSLYNDGNVKEYFTLKSWACVSEDFDAIRVTKTLLHSITSKSDDITDLNFLQGELREQVRGKRFLFVLDDLWNENYIDLNCLQAPFAFGARGSKVLVTTRSKNVACTINNVPIQYLKPLSHEDCWLLLAKHAFGDETPSAHPNLEEIGKKIAGKCNGLPLAAETLGGLLRSKKKDFEEWNSILNSNIWELPYNKSNILPALGLSYHYLPAHLKRCFVYCSIFPKDYDFKKEDMILLWMAEGLVPQDENGSNMEEVATIYFDELLARSLFQKSRKSSFTMHDLINDMAVFMTKGFCFRLEGKESHEVPKTSRHVSYIQEEFDNASKFEPLYGVKRLRTFLPINLRTNGEYFVSKRVSHDFLPTQRCLRVLSLSEYTNVTELPNSIGSLIHLRYLDLSSTAIKMLPDIVCSLFNLQTILLSNCSSLIELPRDMRKLIDLRHLDISGTYIKEMPLQMGRLKSLRTLTAFVVGNSTGSSLTELRELRYLGGSLSVLKLQNVVDSMDALQANLKEKKDLKELVFEWGEDMYDPQNDRDILEKLQPPINLEKLTIKFYGGTFFPNWLGDSSFSKIQFMCLSECSYCLSLPPLGQLPSLKELSVKGMKFLTIIGSEFYGHGSSLIQPFQSLKKLEFEEMLEWEEWQPSGGQCPDFPRLQELILGNCPKLRGNLPNHLPCLKRLSVRECVVLYERATTTTVNMDYVQQYSFEGLGLAGCPGLLSLIGQRTEFMPLLQRLHIGNFVDIECLPKPMVHRNNCLANLHLSKCPSLLSFPLGIFPKLSWLLIQDCVNLESLSTEGVHENLILLQFFDCPNLVSFPHGGLPTPNLRTFGVHKCQNLKSLPERIHTLTALQSLYIEYLPYVVSIAEGGLPPNLRKFSIRGSDHLLETLLMEQLLPITLQTLHIDNQNLKSLNGRGLQHLTSLQSLKFYGCPNLELLPGEALQHLTSLQRLQITYCSSLKFLPVSGLYLTSLQRLQITYCPSLEFLPVSGLPASLSFLGIYRCPSLKKRYFENKTGEEWGKIAHIPCIKIDKEVII